MDIIFNIYNTLFFNPIVNLIVLMLRGFNQINFPGALGFSIIGLTILIKILVWPLMDTQLKSMKKMADLKPELDKLKEKFPDKTEFAKAQMDFYKENNVNPAGGCLPALIQIPPMLAIYQVIEAFFKGSDGLVKINSALYNSAWHLTASPDLGFFGVNLAVHPQDFQKAGMFLLLIPVVTGGLQFLQFKMMAPRPVAIYPTDTKKEKKEKESSEEMAAAMQSQMSFIMPIMFGYLSFTFPIGLALYWNTLTLVGMLQQYLITGWGGLDDWVKKVGLSKVESKK